MKCSELNKRVIYVYGIYCTFQSPKIRNNFFYIKLRNFIANTFFKFYYVFLILRYFFLLLAKCPALTHPSLLTLLIDLIAQQQPLLLRLQLGRVLPVQPVLVRQLDDARVFKLARTLLAQCRLPLGNDVTELQISQHFRFSPNPTVKPTLSPSLAGPGSAPGLSRSDRH